MPRGNVAEEPELPVFPEGSQVGTPDLVVSFSQSYLHKGTGIDEYRYFVIPTNLTEAKYLTALEVRPGNKKVVHHTLVWADSTDASKIADAATPEYGYEGSGGSAAGSLDNQLPGYVPGQKPIVYKDGLAIRIPKQSDLLLQMHYAPSFTDELDSTTINLFFSKEPPKRIVKTYVVLPLPQIISEVFIIQANKVKTFHGKIPISTKTTLLGLGPHCHLLGQNWHVFAIRPGKDTVELIKINEWDFNWQGSYNFVKPIILPAGSVIHALATYDYKTGDEDLNFLDETLAVDYQKDDDSGTVLYPVYPNPAGNETNIYFTLDNIEKITLSIMNEQGVIMDSPFKAKLYASGQHITKLKLHHLLKLVKFL